MRPIAREDAAALGGAASAPHGAVERGARRGDGGVDVGGAAAGDAGERAAVGRILEAEGRAAVGRAPLAADQHARRSANGITRREAAMRGVHGRAPAAVRRLCAIIRTFAPRRGPPISFFLAKRFASFVLTLLAASVVIFTVLDVLPGNAAEVMLGESATPESLAALTAKLGLDRPPLVRYVDWMKGLATGDLGISIAYDTPIAAADRRAAARHRCRWPCWRWR